jgi:hypothetical protein
VSGAREAHHTHPMAATADTRTHGWWFEPAAAEAARPVGRRDRGGLVLALGVVDEFADA